MLSDGSRDQALDEVRAAFRRSISELNTLLQDEMRDRKAIEDQQCKKGHAIISPGC